MSIKAAIFDMDGVIVDNHRYHLEAWKQYSVANGIPFNEEEFRVKHFGKNNHNILSALLNREISAREAFELGEAKEALYREIYRPHIEPTSGLIGFLNVLRRNGCKLAVGTSANRPNLDFVLDALDIRFFFDTLVDASMVSRSKPDPEIFLNAANNLKVNPETCVVFEDSVSGINAAKAAGMVVVALLTTHLQSELPQADYYVKDFTSNDIQKLLNLEL